MSKKFFKGGRAPSLPSPFLPSSLSLFPTSLQTFASRRNRLLLAPRGEDAVHVRQFLRFSAIVLLHEIVPYKFTIGIDIDIRYCSEIQHLIGRKSRNFHTS